MKKISVLLLAFALTLSLAAVASAAEFQPYLGGEFQVVYDGSETAEDNPSETANGGDWARFKMMLTGTVEDEETGTWARIGARLSVWNGNDVYGIYEAGIKDIGGVLDIWFGNDEYVNCKRGQVPLNAFGVKNFAKFGGDPFFDNAIYGNALAFDFNAENVTLNLGYQLNGADHNQIITGGELRFDGGEGHFAYFAESEDKDIFLLGGSYALGFGTLALDYKGVSEDGKDDLANIQGSVSLDDLGLRLTVMSEQMDKYPVDGGIGFGVEYDVTESLLLGAKMFAANEKAEENNDETNFYVGYKYGLFDTRIGMATQEYKDGGDSYIYATVHVGMW